MKNDIQTKLILAIDNDNNSNKLTSQYLHSSGYCVTTTTDPGKAIELLKTGHFHLVITDMEMTGISGLEIIRHVRQNYKKIPVIVLTADSKIKNAVEAMKMGAVDYIEKPYNEKDLAFKIEQVFTNFVIKKSPAIQFKSFHHLIGTSPSMQSVYKMISKASKTKATVLISGESGTGKELVARAIHYNNSNVHAPFVPVNCGGIPDTLLETELFGYVKGAFTGANENRPGFFQTAHNGTIFLDEISETPMAMQTKLLRVIQEKQFYMVGARSPQKVNVRIVAATNTNIETLVKKKLFREDLYYRLNVVYLALPPLRERGDDIVLLINHFLKKYSIEFSVKQPIFTEAAINCITKHSWAGNIRELENVIQSLIIMADGDIIDIPDLPAHLRLSAKSIAVPNQTLEENESEYIQRVLTNMDGNKTLAARILGIDRKTLREKLKKLDILKSV